ncbi:homeobox protein 2 isoform X1 [Sesamum indicum]|uniref:Homeobox protein 2 isoform X1 n=1 Tax=Sesamum indicum TaxID=4182 RepID=A0A6I9TFS5_SESIN|nr:homeobox protein 2 isoform X1 [Sesamum indicum]
MERNNTHSSNRDGLLLRSESRSAATSSSDFVLQWGNRKRLRCMKVQVKDHSNNINNGSGPAQRATARIDRRVVRSDLNNNSSKDPNSNQLTSNNAGKGNGVNNGYLNLRQRPASPSHRILRNSESSLGMRGHSNGVRGLASPDRGDKRSGAAGNNNSSHHTSNKNNNNNGSNHNDNHYHHHGGGGGGGGSGSSETAHDGKKGGSSGGDTIAAMWPPKFVIALTNKEKEEDFLAIKGSKLPQRPKKRAKFIQRTLNLVSPGAWLCDLTLERYEVREKKVSKKRPRGLKAMGNMDSESE